MAPWRAHLLHCLSFVLVPIYKFEVLSKHTVKVSNTSITHLVNILFALQVSGSALIYMSLHTKDSRLDQ